MQQTAYARMVYERRRRKIAGKSTRRSKTLVDVLKNWSRKLITFMFTQIGVAAILIGYNVIGAFVFQELEGQYGDFSIEDTAGRSQNDTINELWSLTLNLNILDEYTWRNKVRSAVSNYENIIIPLIRDKGYRILYPKERWTFSASMMYCLSIYTTIGYGYITPRTTWGKIASICYAMLGMPLMLLYMSNVGEVLARTFKFIYHRACHCGNDSLVATREDVITTNNSEAVVNDKVNTKEKIKMDVDIPKESIPIIWCLCVIGIYVFIGGLMFAHTEGWTTLDGCYFCYISLSTIGHGDIIPGGFVVDGSEVHQIFLSIYLLVGMSLVAMCFNLMQEDALQTLKAFWRGLGCTRKKNTSWFRKASNNFAQEDKEWQLIQLQPVTEEIKTDQV